jgi:hypothetical protein
MDLGAWPDWGSRLAWTLGTLAASWGAGHLLGALIAARVPRWLPPRQQMLVTSTAQVLRRRLPWWSLLIGAWLAAGYWPLTAEGRVSWRDALCSWSARCRSRLRRPPSPLSSSSCMAR